MLLVTILLRLFYEPNLAARSREERHKVNVDLAASGVAYKEGMNQPVIPIEVEMQQPEALKVYFKDRLKFYQQESKTYPPRSDPIYFKEEK